MRDRRQIFFILGAAKSGTSTLHSHLSRHSELHMSDPKEPFFFEAEYDKGLEYYFDRYFRGWDGKRTLGEARHRNLYLGFVPMRIKRVFPDARFLVILRNPADRAFSHWWHWHARGVDKRSFDEALQDNKDRLTEGPLFLAEDESELYRTSLDFSNGHSPFTSYLDSGYYAEQIQRYIDLFGKERLKVLLLEDLARNPAAVMEEVTDFLGVSPLDSSDYEPKNRAMGKRGHQVLAVLRRIPGARRLPEPMQRFARRLVATTFEGRQPKMDPQVRRELLQHYAPHIDQLERMTSRDLSHWHSARGAGGATK